MDMWILKFVFVSKSGYLKLWNWKTYFNLKFYVWILKYFISIYNLIFEFSKLAIKVTIEEILRKVIRKK